MKTILVIDDDHAVVRGVVGILGDEGYRARGASDVVAAQKALAAEAPNLILLDIQLGRTSGLDFLAALPRPLQQPVVVMSGVASISDVVRALQLGATDFVEKPPTPERLLTAIGNALTLRALADEREALLLELAKPGHLIGESAAMRELRHIVMRVGPSEATVTILGETGAGKERVARALHAASGRKGRFVAVNCAAIPATLLESELFGYERGAFSGADKRRLGRIEQAEGGTLLLDEIGDMPIALQAKLLRILEERRIERLGGTDPVEVNVRFLAATHHDLPAAVRAGSFREDLYYRLSVFPIPIPPLRERPDDILPLAYAFAAELVGEKTEVHVTPQAETSLRGHLWPGNVRELRNVIERLSLLRPEGPFVIADIPFLPSVRHEALARPAARTPGLGSASYRELVETYERDLLKAALDECEGNVAQAARLLKTDRGNLHRRIKALGLDAAALG